MPEYGGTSVDRWNNTVPAEDAGSDEARFWRIDVGRGWVGVGFELALKLRTIVCAANLSSSLTGPTGLPSMSWRCASG